MMAHGPLPLFLVCTSFPSGQEFVRFELGTGESLVTGNCSNADVKSQPCRALSPQGSAGLLCSRLATGKDSRDMLGKGSCWHQPLRAQRQGWMLPSLPGAGQLQLLPVLQAGLPAPCLAAAEEAGSCTHWRCLAMT